MLEDYARDSVVSVVWSLVAISGEVVDPAINVDPNVSPGRSGAGGGNDDLVRKVMDDRLPADFLIRVVSPVISIHPAHIVTNMRDHAIFECGFVLVGIN